MHPDDPRAMLLSPLQFPVPEKYFESWVSHTCDTRGMAIFHWSDQSQRRTAAERLATRYGGVFHICEPYRSFTQFMHALAASSGLPRMRSAFEAQIAVIGATAQDSRPLFLEQVEALTPQQFASLRDFHGKSPFLVLTTGLLEPLRWANDQATGWHFASRCCANLSLDD